MEYDLIFSGKVLDNHSVEEVQPKLKKVLKLSDEQLKHLFSGKPITLKKNINHANASNYADKFNRLGAITSITPSQKQAGPIKLSVEKPNTIQPQLELEAMEARTSVNEQENAPEEASENYSDDDEQEPIDVAAYAITTIGVVLILTFLPLPEFSIRYGFVIGLVLAGLGVRRILANRL